MMFLRLFVPVKYPAARQIVGRKLYENAVAGQNSNEIHPDFTGDMSQYFVAALQADSEHGIREVFGNGPFYLDALLFAFLLFRIRRGSA